MMIRSQCLLLILLAVVIAAAGAVEIESRFGRTVKALQFAPADWRTDFASIALSRLAEAYIVEAELARSDSGGSEPKQVRWSRGVESYASKLIFLQLHLDHGQAVSLTLSPLSEATVEIAEQRVMLTHPRPEQQTAFEQGLLEQFCQQRDCQLLTEGNVITAPIPTAVVIDPSWAFTDDGPMCSYEGIRLQFAPGDNPGAVRKWCTALFQDVAEILRGMLQQQQHGVRIDWQYLTLSTPPGQLQQMLRLNAAGDTLLLELSLIPSKPELLSALQPWLTARAVGRTHTLTLRAREFGWQVGENGN